MRSCISEISGPNQISQGVSHWPDHLIVLKLCVVIVLMFIIQFIFFYCK